jgi:hypothetical protein
MVLNGLDQILVGDVFPPESLIISFTYDIHCTWEWSGYVEDVALLIPLDDSILR